MYCAIINVDKYDYFYLVNNEEQAVYLCALLFCVELPLSIVCIFALHCILNIVFLLLCCFSRALHPHYSLICCVCIESDSVCIIYFDQLPLDVFQCAWSPCGCCLILIYSFVGVGIITGLWILLGSVSQKSRNFSGDKNLFVSSIGTCFVLWNFAVILSFLLSETY